MAGIRGELALALKSSLQAAEHFIEGGGQLAQLVIRLQVDAPGQVAFADLAGSLGDGFDGTHGAVRQPVAAEHGQCQQTQPGQDQGGQQTAQLVTGIQRAAQQQVDSLVAAD